MTLAVRSSGTLEPSSSNLADWADSARQASTIAVSIAKTPFVPASLRDRDPDVTAANITAAILTGQEIGLEPMAALRSIDVIQGVPAMRAITLRAVVLSRGHEIWVAESTQTRAVVRGRRKGSSETQESRWDMDRARALGLVNKDNWKKQPGAMLVARATAECARLVAADAILGIPYAIEELEDGPLEQAAPLEAVQSARKTAQRRTPQPSSVAQAAVPLAEPEAVPEPELEGLDVFAPEPPTDQRTDAQSKKLWALLNENDLGDRDAALAFISATLGTEIESTKDLTVGQCSRVIERLLELGATPADPADGETLL